METIHSEIPPDDLTEVSCIDYLKIVNFDHMHALIWKNFLWMWRNIPMMLFMTLLPVGKYLLQVKLYITSGQWLWYFKMTKHLRRIIWFQC